MKKFRWIEAHPVEAVIFVFSFCLAVLAINILSPWYDAQSSATIAQGITGRLPEIGLGLFFLGSSIPGLAAPFSKAVPNKWLERGTMGIFMSFLFMGILRIAVYGWMPLTWVTILAVAIAAGILRMYLRSHR